MQALNATERQEKEIQNAHAVVQQLENAKLKLKLESDSHGRKQMNEQFWAGVEGSMILLKRDQAKHKAHKVITHHKKHDGDSWLFDPHNKYKVFWDVIISILVIFSILSVPFRIAFDLPTSLALLIFDYLQDSLFMADILVTGNTALHDPKFDRLETNRSVIIFKYLRFWFWVDLLSSLPMEELSSGSSISSARSSAFRLVRTFRLFRLLKLGKVVRLERLNEHLEKLNFNPSLINVFTLLAMLLGMSHLVACFWVLLGRGGGASGDSWKSSSTWITASNLQDEGVIDQYVAALYWTLATVLSIGYGDIHAVTSSERIFAIFTMLMGGVMFGAIISQISRLTAARNPTQKLVAVNMTELGVYLKQKNFPTPLNNKIKAAYDYYFSKKSVLMESGGILDELSDALASKLTRLLFEKEISRINVFARLEQKFVNLILINSKPFETEAGVQLFDYGDVSDEVIFVLTGVVKIETKSGSRDVVAGYASDGGFVGDFEFLTRSLRISKCTTVSKCSLLSISDSMLQALCDENYEAGLDLKNEITDRYTVFRNVIKLPAITSVEAKARLIGRGRLGRSLRIAKTSFIGQSSSKAEAVVRTKLWVNGNLQSHSNVNVDLNAAHHTRVVSYRYLVLSSEKERVIEEGPLRMFAKDYLVHPKEPIKGYWDFLVGLFIIYSVVAVPVTVAFTPQVSRGRDLFELCVDGMFLLDCAVNFRTSYFDESMDAYVAIPSMISAKYLKWWFYIDFLSSIPFDNLINWAVSSALKELSSIRLIKIIRLTRLLKLIRIVKLSRYVRTLEERFGVSILVFELINMVSVVLLLGHLLACAWWAISIAVSSEGWYDDPSQLAQNLKDTASSTQYITSLYQIVTTLTTTGYGDLYPVNSSERITMMFIMCIGASTFGYIVGSVASLVGTINQSSAIRTERLTAISSFLSERSCPQDLSGSIMRHFRHVYAEVAAVNETIILERLPKSLVLEMTLLEHADKIQHIPIFQYIDNLSIRIFLFKLLRPVFFDTDQHLVREGDMPKEIIFLVSGRARIFHQTELRKLRLLQHKRGGMHRRVAVASSNNLAKYMDNAKKIKLMQTKQLVLTNQSALVDNSSHSITTSAQALQAVASVQEMRSLSHKSNNETFLPSSLSPRHHSTSADLNLNSVGKFGSSIVVAGVTGASFFGRKVSDKAGDFTRKDSSSSSSSLAEDVAAYAESQADDVVEIIHRSNGTSGDTAASEAERQQVVAETTLFHKRSQSRDLLDFDNSRASPRATSERRQSSRSGKRLNPFKQFFKSKEAVKEQKKSMRQKKSTPFHLMSNLEHKQKGREVIGDLVSGDIIGHVAMMNNCEFKASVRAIGPCSAYLLHKNTIIELIARYPGVAMVLQTALGRAASDALQANGSHYVRSKRAEFLKDIKFSSLSKMRKSTADIPGSQTPTLAASSLPTTAPTSASTVSGNSAKVHPTSATIHEDFELDAPVVSEPKISAKDRWKTAKIKSLNLMREQDKQAQEVTSQDRVPVASQPEQTSLPERTIVRVTPTASQKGVAIKRQESESVSVSMVLRLNKVVKTVTGQTKRLQDVKNREAALETVLPEAKLYYESDDDTVGGTTKDKHLPVRFTRSKSSNALFSLPRRDMVLDAGGESSLEHPHSAMYNGLRRQQSFPSLGNKVWKQTQQYDIFL